MSGSQSLRQQEIRTEVRKEIGALGLLYGAGIGRMKNRAFTATQGTLPHAVTAASAIIFAAAKLQVKGSGIFFFTVSVSLTGATATDTLDFNVSTQQAAISTMTMTNAAQVGPGTSGGGTVTSGAFVSNAAAGITVAGGAVAALTQADSGAQVLGTAATTLTWAWSGYLFQAASTTLEKPFTSGDDLIVTVSLNQSANTQVFTACNVSLTEMP